MKSFIQANLIILLSTCQVEAILLIHQSTRFGLSFPNLQGFLKCISLEDTIDVDRDFSGLALNGKWNYILHFTHIYYQQK